MTDLDLLTFGCAVTFITLAGVYVGLRVRFEQGPREAAVSTAPPKTSRKLKDAA